MLHQLPACLANRRCNVLSDVIDFDAAGIDDFAELAEVVVEVLKSTVTLCN